MRRVISLCMAILFLLQVYSLNIRAEEIKENSSKVGNNNSGLAFKDIAGHWAESKINALAEKGYVKGYETSDGNIINPDSKITRAEYLSIVLRTVKLQKIADKVKEFSDVKEGDWYKEAVDIASSNGIIGGYPDGSFGANNSITRAEIAFILSKVNKWDETKPSAIDKFADVDQAEWYYSAVMTCKSRRIINGYPDGGFGPNAYATRAETFAIVENALSAGEKLKDEDVPAGKPVVTNSVTPTNTNAAKVTSTPTQALVFSGGGGGGGKSKKKVAATPTQVIVPTDVKVTVTPIETTVPTRAKEPTTTVTPTPTDAKVPTATETLAPTDVKVPTATETLKPTDVKVPTAKETLKPTDVKVPTATETPKPTNTKVPTTTVTPELTKIPINKDDISVDILSSTIIITQKGDDDNRNNTKALFKYALKNGYGDDVTNSVYSDNIKWSIEPFGDDFLLVADKEKGIVKITEDSDASYLCDNRGREISVYAYNYSDNLLVSKKLTICPVIGGVKEFRFTGLIKREDNAEIMQGVDKEFILGYEAKDYDGNPIDYFDVFSNEDIFSFDPDPYIEGVDSWADQSKGETAMLELRDDNGKLKIVVKASDDWDADYGKTMIKATCYASGFISTYEVDVKKKAAIDSLTLGDHGIAYPGTTLEIPFTAVDTYGKSLTDYDDIIGLRGDEYTEFKLKGSNNARLRTESVNGKLKIYVDVPADEDSQIILNAVVADTGKASRIVIPVDGVTPGDITEPDPEETYAIKKFELFMPACDVTAGMTIEIPYVALDANGQPVTDHDILADALLGYDPQISLKVKGDAEIRTEECCGKIRILLDAFIDSADENIKLKWTDEYASGSINIIVNDASFPHDIIKVQNVSPVVLQNSSMKGNVDNFIIVDQNGNNINLGENFRFYDYRSTYCYIYASSSNPEVVRVKQSTVCGNTNFELEGCNKKGSAIITYKLVDDNDLNYNNGVNGVIDSIDVKVKCISGDDIVKCEIDNIPLLSAAQSENDQIREQGEEVNICGYTAKGEKVSLPNTYVREIVLSDTDKFKLQHYEGEPKVYVCGLPLPVGTTATGNVKAIIDIDGKEFTPSLEIKSKGASLEPKDISLGIADTAYSKRESYYNNNQCMYIKINECEYDVTAIDFANSMNGKKVVMYDENWNFTTAGIFIKVKDQFGKYTLLPDKVTAKAKTSDGRELAQEIFSFDSKTNTVCVAAAIPDRSIIEFTAIAGDITRTFTIHINNESPCLTFLTSNRKAENTGEIKAILSESFAKPEILELKRIGSGKILVKFSAPVSDPNKAELWLSKGNVNVDSFIQWSEGNTEAMLFKNGHYNEGEYTLRGSYEGASMGTKTIVMEEEKISMEITSPSITIVRKGDEECKISPRDIIKYSIKNQFGEDVTKSDYSDGFEWLVGPFDSNEICIDRSKGIIIITEDYDENYMYNNRGKAIDVFAFNSDYNVCVKKSLPISATIGLIKDFKFTGLTNEDGKTEIVQGSDDEFILGYEARDFDGNLVDDYYTLAFESNLEVYGDKSLKTELRDLNGKLEIVVRASGNSEIGYGKTVIEGHISDTEIADQYVLEVKKK